MLRTISRMMSRAVAGLAAAGRSIVEPASILTVRAKRRTKGEYPSTQRRRDAEINAEKNKTRWLEGAGFRRWRGWRAEGAEHRCHWASFTQRNPILSAQ